MDCSSVQAVKELILSDLHNQVLPDSVIKRFAQSSKSHRLALLEELAHRREVWVDSRPHIIRNGRFTFD